MLSGDVKKEGAFFFLSFFFLFFEFLNLGFLTLSLFCSSCVCVCVLLFFFVGVASFCVLSLSPSSSMIGIRTKKSLFFFYPHTKKKRGTP